MIHQTQLTVSRVFYPNRWATRHLPLRSVPFIRIAGLYLAKAGIHEGSSIQVTVHQGSITITPV